MFAWFFVYTHHGYHLEQIEYDGEHWTKVKANLVKFWIYHLAPKLIQHFTPSETKCTTTSSTKEPLSHVGIPDPILKHLPIHTKKVKRKKTKSGITRLKLYACYVWSKDCVDNADVFEENSICCSKCKRWLHFGCVNIRKEEEVPHTKAKWLCGKCK